MKRDEITRRMAAQASSSTAEAADRLDRVVCEIIQKLRKGRRAVLPGLGNLLPNPERQSGGEDRR